MLENNRFPVGNSDVFQGLLGYYTILVIVYDSEGRVPLAYDPSASDGGVFLSENGGADYRQLYVGNYSGDQLGAGVTYADPYERPDKVFFGELYLKSGYAVFDGKYLRKIDGIFPALPADYTVKYLPEELREMFA